MLTLLILTIIAIAASMTTVIFRRYSIVSVWPAYFHLPAIIVLSTGVILTCYALDTIQAEWQMKKWPAISATVIKSEVAGQRAFHPEVTYRFLLDDQEYQSTTNLSTAGFGGKRSRRDTASRIIADFPPGSLITIHYNPLNPKESFLRSGPFWDDYMKLALGLMLTGVASLIVFSLLIRRFLT